MSYWTDPRADVTAPSKLVDSQLITARYPEWCSTVDCRLGTATILKISGNLVPMCNCKCFADYADLMVRSAKAKLLDRRCWKLPKTSLWLWSVYTVQARIICSACPGGNPPEPEFKLLPPSMIKMITLLSYTTQVSVEAFIERSWSEGLDLQQSSNRLTSGPLVRPVVGQPLYHSTMILYHSTKTNIDSAPRKCPGSQGVKLSISSRWSRLRPELYNLKSSGWPYYTTMLPAKYYYPRLCFLGFMARKVYE